MSWFAAKKLLPAVGTAFCLIGPGAAQISTALEQTGSDLAHTHCARCHVIPDHNPYGGIESTPSFRLLARRDDYLERLQSFYARPPHPVFVRVPGVPPLTNDPAFVVPFEVLPEQIDDLVAFVEAIRAQQ